MYSEQEIKKSVRETGLTPSELENEAYANGVDDREELRNFFAKQYSTYGVNEYDVELSPRELDLKEDFLFEEYLDYLMFHNAEPDNVHFRDYAFYVASKALVRLYTHTRDGHTLIDELYKDAVDEAPRRAKVYRFAARMKDMSGLHPLLYYEFLVREIPEAEYGVVKILERYQDELNSTLDAKTDVFKDVRIETFPHEYRLQLAVNAYLGGATLTTCCERFKLSNRVLSRALKEQGVMRSQGRTKGE